MSITKSFLYLSALLVLAALPLAAQAPELKINAGHSALVSSVCFSPDDTAVASGSEDKTVKLWDARTGRELKTFQDDGELRTVQFVPDGKSIVGAGWGGVTVWNVSDGTGTEICPQLVHFASVSKNAKFLIYDDINDGESIVLYDLARKKTVRKLAGHTDSVVAATFSPDGKYIASCSYDGTTRLWDASSGKQLNLFRGNGADVVCVAFSPDGRYLASGGGTDDPVVRIWGVPGGRLTRELTGHENAVESVAWSPDGRTIASSSADGTIRFHDLATGDETRVIADPNGSTICSIAFASDGESLAAASSDKTVRIWDASVEEPTDEPRVSLPGEKTEVRQIAFTTDGTKLVTRDDDDAMKSWGLSGGTGVRPLLENVAGELEYAMLLCFSDDGRFALVSTGDAFYVYDADSGDQLQGFAGEYCDVAAFSADGRYIAYTTSWSESGENIEVVDTETGGKVRTFDGAGGSFGCLAFSPDGRYLAAGGEYEDYRVRVWNVSSGKQVVDAGGHENAVQAVRFSPDGGSVASASCDGTIRFHDLRTGKETLCLTDETGSMVSSIAFSPDGKRLASGHYYQEYAIKLWNLATGERESVFTGLQGDVNALAFSPDGKRVASASADGAVKIWDAKTGSCLLSRYDIPGSPDWVAVSQDGRFDGTEQGMKLLYYVQGLDIIPLESFYERYFTPALSSRVLAGSAKAVAYQAPVRPQIRMPPKVRIATPADRDAFTTDRVTVTVEATDQGGGIDEILLYQNGKLVETTQRGLKVVQTANTKLIQNFTVPLAPGANVFRATAFNADRTEGEPDTVTVSYSGAERNTTLHLFVVGINDYKNPDYSLSYAYPDAQAIRSKIEETGRGIFRDIKVHALYNRDATKKNIQAAIAEIEGSATAADFFLFFYAGHGVMTEADGEVPARYYIIPSDVVKMYGSAAALEELAISADEMRDWCKNIPAQKQVILLDACQSGGTVETFAMRGATEEKAIMQLGRSAGIVILASTGTQQAASEFAQLKHGIFTYALLEGLDGKADGGSRDGKITIKELESFVNDYIPELSRKYRGEVQYPNSYSTGMDFPVGVTK